VANRYDLTIQQGATFSIVATWAGSNGSAVNLTGYTAAMTLRDSYAATGTVLYLASGSGITLGGTAGTITITAAATATAALAAPSTGVYDLELTTGATVYRLLEGGFTITPEATK
jgi:hypothetical protein